MSMRKKIISVSVLAIAIIMAVTIVTIALYNWIPKTNTKSGEDRNEDLLYSKCRNMNISDIFLEEYEIQQVATRYSTLHKYDNKRRMYVFSMPVRNYSDEGRY